MSKRLIENILFRVEMIPEELINLVHTKAEGNPYYIEELVKILIEDEVIIRDSTKWYIKKYDLTKLRIPTTLTGILQAKLDNLPEKEQLINQQAAVIGRTFWKAILSFINESEENQINYELDKLLSELEIRELVSKSPFSTFKNSIEYFFNHGIFREVAYESVLKKKRQVYHSLIADWLIEYNSERSTENSGLIAFHLENAKRINEAIDNLSQSGEAALTNHAIEEASKYFNRALKLTPKSDLERNYRLFLGLESVLSAKGNRFDQKKILDSLSLITNDIGDEYKKIELLIRKVWYYYWVSSYHEMHSVSYEAYNSSKNLKNLSFIQQSAYALAWSNLLLGNVEKALDFANDALIIVEKLNDKRGKGNILNVIGLVKISQGDFFKANQLQKEFLEISQIIGDKDREITALNNLGVTYTRLGNFLEAEETLFILIEIAKEIGDKLSLSSSFVNLAWIKASKEQWEDGLRFGVDGVAMKREFGHVEGIAEGLMWVGHCWFGLRNYEKAILAYNEAYNIRKKLELYPLAMEALAGLIRALKIQGDKIKSNDYVETIINFLENGGTLESTWEPIRIYLTCIQELRENNDPRLEKLLDPAYTLLQKTSLLIPNLEAKKKFLENIPWHKEVMKLKNQ